MLLYDRKIKQNKKQRRVVTYHEKGSIMKINYKNQTIEMTKKFASAAKYYGSDAYKQLQEARRDYPTFRVITKQTAAKKRDNYKGLTVDFMEEYIKKHDDGDGSIMAKFDNLRATSEEAKAVGAKSASFFEIKEWFLKQFPAFAEFQKKREEILAA